MTPAAVSLLALLAAIALSCTSRINVGLLAVALAWLVGIYAGRVELVTSLEDVPSGLLVRRGNAHPD